MSLGHSARTVDSPLLPFSAEVMPGSSMNIFGRNLRETRNQNKKWNFPMFSVFSRGSRKDSSTQNKKRQRIKRGSFLDSSLFHSPHLSRLRSPLPSLPHIAFPLSSIPSSMSSSEPRPHDSVATKSSSSNMCRDRGRQSDSLPIDHNLITLTPPSCRYQGPAQQIQNLMNAFSSSSSSPSPATVLPRPTSTFSCTLPQSLQHSHQYRSSSNHHACSSFFSFQVNTHQRENQTTCFPYTAHGSFSSMTQSQGKFDLKERKFYSHDYQFEDHPKWWQNKTHDDEEGRGLRFKHNRQRKLPACNLFQDKTGKNLNRSLMDPVHHLPFLSGHDRLQATRINSWLSTDEGEDDVFLSNQEMEKMGQRAWQNSGNSDSEDDVWVLQTEL